MHCTNSTALVRIPQCVYITNCVYTSELFLLSMCVHGWGHYYLFFISTGQRPTQSVLFDFQMPSDFQILRDFQLQSHFQLPRDFQMLRYFQMQMDFQMH